MSETILSMINAPHEYSFVRANGIVVGLRRVPPMLSDHIHQEERHVGKIERRLRLLVGQVSASLRTTIMLGNGDGDAHIHWQMCQIIGLHALYTAGLQRLYDFIKDYVVNPTVDDWSSCFRSGPQSAIIYARLNNFRNFCASYLAMEYDNIFLLQQELPHPASFDLPNGISLFESRRRIYYIDALCSRTGRQLPQVSADAAEDTSRLFHCSPLAASSDDEDDWSDCPDDASDDARTVLMAPSPTRISSSPKSQE